MARDAVKCNKCNWIRRVQNALPPENSPETPATYSEAVASHYIESGHYNASYPVEGHEAPMLTEGELAVGYAYRKGHADGRQSEWAEIDAALAGFKRSRGQ